jgi:hypothetical protein
MALNSPVLGFRPPFFVWSTGDDSGTACDRLVVVSGDGAPARISRKRIACMAASGTALTDSEERRTILMMDVFYLAITLLFFGVAAAYVRGCEKL